MNYIKSFDNLKHGDKIISPLDNEVTEFLIDNQNEKFLANKTCMYPYFQFDPKDFYMYTGNKNVGEKDPDFFKPKAKSKSISTIKQKLYVVCDTDRNFHYVVRAISYIEAIDKVRLKYSDKNEFLKYAILIADLCDSDEIIE